MLPVALLLAGVAHAQYQLELTFDDDGNGTTLSNLETSSGVTASLDGDAERTAYGDGRYGRGVALGPGGGVRVAGWTMRNDLVAHLWLAPDGDGPILALQPGWFVGLVDSELTLVTPNGPQPMGLAWPDDGDWHHLTVRATALMSATASVEAEVDFGAPALAAAAPPTAPQLRVGGLEGRIDELIVANRPTATKSEDQDRFNRDPDTCIAGAVCTEQLLDVRVGELDFDVPLRFKLVWDPDRCNASTPCPLLVAVNGGETCANDYTSPDELDAMLASDVVIATPDPYCEGLPSRTKLYREELEQLLIVKDHLQATEPAITPGDYLATGCSHGAEAVMIWALHDPDPPARTFVRSAGGSGLCAGAAGVLCGTPGLPPDADLETMQDTHEVSDFVGMVTPERTRDREVARTWGRAFDGVACNPDGTVACSEEGETGMTYASRRFRDVWQGLQDPADPTGWFAADLTADCQHCAPPGSTAFECGMCLLEVGRAGMAEACPACLGPDVDRDDGLAADACPLDASWYADPLDALGTTPDATHESAPEGCGCAATSSASTGGWLVLLALLLPWLRQGD